MSNSHSQPDITIRGGLINVPHSTKPIHPPPHQPATPPVKKQTKPRPDHIPAATKTPKGTNHVTTKTSKGNGS